MLSDQHWNAIVANDSSFDGLFFYAVKTTGIYCRPSCRSRVPNRAHVTVFEQAEQAVASGYRPCKRCKPEGRRLPDEDWVDQIIRIIESRFAEPLTLDALADAVHGSRFHLQRTFKRVTGLSPAAYLRQTRLAEAKRLLANTDMPIADIASAVGMPSAAHFATWFQKNAHTPPSEYRRNCKRLIIHEQEGEQKYE
ncbi:transcriptional regulator, AraC family [Paenibacillus curdlanolyticus YK9]|uniref:Transcriptional regulator, AraC family n=1 Tax=Paenibacillus curdlanolyticus YK9 TaxID=717606 RepID=E0I853_9BACL|nr:bifunctional transcriptional activator/DNA repair enzyme AdaA [Paenibacillus curdlanolyticus]EFM11358.1 transcriptional regulator, AraC family [Paenibacillus curdlanolyticus YK9]